MLGSVLLTGYAIGASTDSTTDSTSSNTTSTTSSDSGSLVTSVPPTSASPSTAPVQLAPDASDTHRPFVISCTLREAYDDNIFTAHVNKVGSFETIMSPSILFDLPMQNSSLSLRETFGATYYESRPGSQFDFDNDFVARFTHNFSDRFSMDASEDFRYSTEPSLFDSTGTLYRNGGYITNTINGDFTAQWTPLFSTLSTFSNTIVNYESSSVGTEQNSQENIGSQNFSWAILPKISFVVGGIVDNISYDDINRGYTSYTGNTGIDWQALPSMTLGVRVGGSYTTTDSSGDLVSPYGSLTFNWKLGARSTLNFAYTHSTTPTDVTQASAQTADRLDVLFNYDVTSSITTHLEGIYTYSSYPQNFVTPGTISNFSENDYAVDLGADYHCNKYMDLEAGYTFSGVSSELDFRDYTRNVFYVGVRGTY